MQIDWISAFVESPEWEQRGYFPYDTGQILKRDTDGVITRVGTGSELLEGSHSSNLLIRSPVGHQLYISGNPVKHLQGHNLFGSDDATGLLLDVGQRIRAGCGLFPSAETFTANGFRKRYTCLDYTRSYRFVDELTARAWLRDVAASARSRHGGALCTGNTVYLGKNSERWSFKLYSKLDEITSARKGHALSASLPDEAKAQLMMWACGIVRFELRVRSKEIEKLEHEFGQSIDTIEPDRIWGRYFNKITWNRNADMKKADLLEQTLPRHLRGVLAMWRQGVDLRTVSSQATFYRNRRELLDKLGVDIASPPPADVPADVPQGSAELDPKGWDPEPIRKLLHEPDPTLKLRYGV